MAASSETLTNTTAANTGTPGLKVGPLDIVRDRWIYIGLSLLFLVPGLFYIVTNWLNPDIQAPVRLGIDFTGGTMLEYGFHSKVTESALPKIKSIFEEKGYHGTVVQIQKPRTGINDDETLGQSKLDAAKLPATKPEADTLPASKVDANALPKSTADVDHKTVEQPSALQAEADALKKESAQVEASPSTASKNVNTIIYIRSKHLSTADQSDIHQALTRQFGDNTVLQNYSIGPSLANELLQNGLLALGLAYLLIVGYLTYRFEFDYALCAILSLVHDALFVFGIFAILGHFFNTEVDSMFITAILTVVGFSVHDTIVVYDRVRENSKIYFTKKLPFSVIANLSVNQTLLRSLSTSATVLLTLLALYLFGGDTTKDFIFACLVGIAIGTYSSIFVATPLLTWMRDKRQKPA